MPGPARPAAAPATPPGGQEEAEGRPAPSPPPPPAPSTAPSGGPLAVGAVALGAALFIAVRLLGVGAAAGSLSDVAAGSVPLATALASGRPTVVEFYADYCEVRGQREA